MIDLSMFRFVDIFPIDSSNTKKKKKRGLYYSSRQTSAVTIHEHLSRVEQMNPTAQIVSK